MLEYDNNVVLEYDNNVLRKLYGEFAPHKVSYSQTVPGIIHSFAHVKYLLTIPPSDTYISITVSLPTRHPDTPHPVL